MATNAQYQAKYRKRMEAAGMKQVTGFIPKHMAPSARLLFAYLCENPQLDLGSILVRNPDSGQFVRVQL